MHHDDSPTRSGAARLAGLIHRLGNRHVFHIPGEGILEILDALASHHPDIALVTFRHEGGMAYAAQAHARLLGQPAICLAGRAPGALNTALALHTAHTDAAPMILIVGQPALAEAGRDPLSGDDLQQALRPLVKEVITVTHAARLGEAMMRAWAKAMGGRMGPVVVVVTEEAMRGHAPAAELPVPVPAAPAPSPRQTAALAARLQGARRPVVIVGGSGWDEAARRQLHGIARRHGWPVVAAYRRADLFDNEDPHYGGELGIGIDPALARLLAESDLIVAINVRLGEINTFGPGGFGGFRLLDAPLPAQDLVHVHPCQDELNRVYRAALAIHAAPGLFLDALAPALEAALPGAVQAGWTARWHAARRAFVSTGSCPPPVDLKAVFGALREHVPADTVFTVGAGAYAVWLHRYVALRQPGTLLGPKSGAMGYGLPAAIGAALAHPGRRVVALAGDGCLLMHGEELATAVQHRLPIIIVLINNHGYGAIRSAQLKQFGKAVGTALHQPDFVRYALAFGAHAERVSATGAFAPALRRALDAAGPALIEVTVPDTVSKPQ